MVYDLENIVAEWQEHNFICRVIAGPSGTYNGYVGITNSHPFFGASYDGDIDYNDINVHGGLTFASMYEDRWWLGFDTGHAGDSIQQDMMYDQMCRRSYVEIRKKGELDGGFPRNISVKKLPFPFSNGRVWSIKKVRAEVEKLSNQLHVLERIENGKLQGQ